jgi:hypothetical protein
MAVALRVNVKDSKERAAEMAGVLNFIASRGIDAAAAGIGAATGGVATLPAEFAAHQVKELAEDHIQGFARKFAGVERGEVLRNTFVAEMKTTLISTMAVSLWGEERIRTHLLAQKDFRPPPSTYAGGSQIVPPLEDSPGRLHVPPPSTPAYHAFHTWLAREGGTALKTLATECLHESTVYEAFESTIVEALFKE